MADCSTLWARGRLSCAGPPTSVLLTGRHIQSMPTAVEDILVLSPRARRILADMEVRRRECISTRGSQSWKMIFCSTGNQWRLRRTGVMWSNVVSPSCSRHITSRSILCWLKPFYLSVSYSCQQSTAVVQATMYKRLYQWPQTRVGYLLNMLLRHWQFDVMQTQSQRQTFQCWLGSVVWESGSWKYC